MSGSVLVIGPHRPVHEVFDPLWSEFELERQRFTSTSAAMEIVRSGRPPAAVLVSYPLWDTTIEALLESLERELAGEAPVPIVVLTQPTTLAEVAELESQGMTVLCEDTGSTQLQDRLRRLLGPALRAHPRFIVRMSVQVGAGSVLRACQSVDLSLSGMLIRTSEEFPVGSDVDLEFSLRDEDDSIRCRAQVVRYTPSPDQEASNRGMGVHFLSFEKDGEERLADFLGHR